MLAGRRRRAGGRGCKFPAAWLWHPGLLGGQAVVVPSRSRRRRKWTAAINALSGVVAVGSLVVVIELGAPVASNLGLGLGPGVTSGQGSTGSPVPATPTLPSVGQATPSVISATSPILPAPSSGGTTSPGSSASDFSVAVLSAGPSTVTAQPAVAATGGTSGHVVPLAGTGATAPSSNGGDGAGPTVLVETQTPNSGSQQQGQHGHQGPLGQNGATSSSGLQQQGQDGPPGQSGHRQNGQNGQGPKGNQGPDFEQGPPSDGPPGKALGHDKHV